MAIIKKKKPVKIFKDAPETGDLEKLEEKATMPSLVDEAINELEKTEVATSIFNLEGAESSQAVQRSTGSGGKGMAGVITIINSATNGKRFGIGKVGMDHLGNPDSVSVFYIRDKMIVSAGVEGYQQYKVRKSKNKVNVYCSGLVLEIAEKYNIDFSDRVSATFYEAEYAHDNNGKAIIIVKMNES